MLGGSHVVLCVGVVINASWVQGSVAGDYAALGSAALESSYRRLLLRLQSLGIFWRFAWVGLHARCCFPACLLERHRRTHVVAAGGPYDALPRAYR